MRCDGLKYAGVGEFFWAAIIASHISKARCGAPAFVIPPSQLREGWGTQIVCECCGEVTAFGRNDIGVWAIIETHISNARCGAPAFVRD